MEQPKLSVDVSHLSETERQAIYGVLKRDEDLRKRDEQRINRLKSELQYLRRRGAIRGGADPLTTCGRCRSELGKIINRGAPCVVCRAKICKVCRVYAKDGTQWICVVCHKQLELEAATGEWMNEFVRRASRKRDKRGLVPPSDIVKELIIRSQSEGESNQERFGNGGQHTFQEKGRPKRGPSLALSARPKSAGSGGSMEQRSPTFRRVPSSECEPPPAVSGTPPQQTAGILEYAEPSQADADVIDRRVSEVPIPAPRQKSPLLKQRAVLLESESMDAVQPTAAKRMAPRPPPLIQHHSDRSDSGIGAENQPSPKTSQSSSAHSRQSSTNSSGKGHWNAQTESQATDSASENSDSEVEPSTGVVFRKVTLKRRKRKDGPKKQASDGRSDVDWADPCPPWSGSFSLPRISVHNSRSSPTWDASCDPAGAPLTRTNSSDSLWWDAAKTLVLGGGADVWLAVDNLGLAPGLSRSLGAVHDVDSGVSGDKEYGSSWIAETNGLGDADGDWNRGAKRCRRSASYEDLRVSSPEYEEDFPLDFQCGGVKSADSYSDILYHVTDKILPEGEEYRIVFISSSSSKSSGLNSSDGISSGGNSASSSRRVSMLMEDAEWDRISATISPSPPPLPLVPPPSRDRPNPGANPSFQVQDEDFFNYFREFADAEWKETSVAVAEESECDEDDCANSSERSGGYSLILPLLDQPPFSLSRTDSLRSSGECSISEQSFYNQVFQEQNPVVAACLPEPCGVLESPTTIPSVVVVVVEPETCEVQLVNLDEEESDGEESADGFYLDETIDSSDDECVFGSYNVNMNFSDEEAAPPEGPDSEAVESSENEVSDGYFTESESIMDSVELGDEVEEEEEDGVVKCADDDSQDVNPLLDDLSIPDAPQQQQQQDDVQRRTESDGKMEISVSIKISDSSDRAEELEESDPGIPAAVRENNGKSEKSVALHDSATEKVEEINCDLTKNEAGSESSVNYSNMRVITQNSSERSEDNKEQRYVPLDKELEEAGENSPLHSESSSSSSSSYGEDCSDAEQKMNELIAVDQCNAEENIEIIASEGECAMAQEVESGHSSVWLENDRIDHLKAASEIDSAAVSEKSFENGPEIVPQPIESTDHDEIVPESSEEVVPVNPLDETSLQRTEIADLEGTDAEESMEADEDGHGETSSDGEKLESDTDSLDTVIEGESFRRMRQMAIRQKLLQVNEEFDAREEEAGGQKEPADEKDSEQVTGSPEKVSPINKPNLQELVAQSRALAASFKDSEEDAIGGSSSAAGGASVLEKYFVSSLEHMAPPIFNRNRSRQQPIIKTEVAASPPADDPIDEIIIESYQAGSEDGDFTDSCSETHSEDNFNCPMLLSAEEDSETTFDEDDDSSSTDSTSSDEGTACLRSVVPRQCTVVDDAWYRLDMSLHTIMEESCEESETERERHVEDRKRIKARSADPSQLERYFQFTFNEPSTSSGAVADLAPSDISSADKNDEQSKKSSDSSSRLSNPRFSIDDGEYSDDTFSETESSVFSESNNRDDAEVDDEELARLASSRLEKYFLTGFLGLQVGYPEDAQEEVVTPTCDEPPQPFSFVKKNDAETRNATKNETKVSSESSREETDDDIPFEKNDSCDTIKRKKKSNLEMDDPDIGEAINSLKILEQGENNPDIEPQDVVVEAKNIHLEESVAKSFAGEEVPVSIVSEDDASANTKDIKLISTEGPNENLQKLPSESEKRNEQNLLAKDCSSLPVDIIDVEVGEDGATQLLSFDPSSYGCGDASSPGFAGSMGRGLTLDWKQQSRDSGFIGSSDDLLQDSCERVMEDVDEEDPKDDSKEAVVKDLVVGEVFHPTGTSVTAATVVVPPIHAPFGLFRSSSTRSNFYAASTTSDDEAQYIVNQLVTQIAKSMARSPQLARAKPPEIEVFETELTKLMQTVPGIDATVKEIVEELSSTDYCSDSYESSDYTSSDQEGQFPMEITRQTLYNLQLHRNDSGRSWRSITSSTSKSSSTGQKDGDGAGLEDGQKLPEETMYIYQRFMDSLAKMTEQASEEAKASDVGGGGGLDGTSGSATNVAKGSPPTPVKMLHHIRSKLTSLMREVNADKSPRLGGGSSLGGSGRSQNGPPPRRTIAWNKPGSGSGSAAGDELSISSTSSANFDSEDSPTDTELSMDSDEPAASLAANTRALAQAQAQVKLTVKSGSGYLSGEKCEEDGSADGLERWSSDMTIVDDDVRYSSIHKSEPILSMPESGDERRNSRDLSLLSKTLPSGRSGHSAHPNPSAAHQAATSQRPRSIGSLSHLIGSSGNKRSSKNDWEAWRDDGKPSSASSSSSLVSVSGHRTPYKHKSYDPLPPVRSKTELRASAAATSRDRKKHGFAFMLRQKSGSSMSLREGGNGGQENKSIKQQIQFRSSLHLQSEKSKDEQRSSSLHRLFGGANRNSREISKKGLGTARADSTPSVKSCWSSPDVGVDVTTATGVDLSDSESNSGSNSGKGSRPSSAHYPSSNVTSIYIPSGAYSTQDLSASQKAKASTLPRAGSDLHANVSFLHKSNRHNLTSTNTLPTSYTSLVPQQEATSGGNGKEKLQRQLTTGSKATNHKSVVQVIPPESPKARRETHSWPATEENNVGSKSEVSLVSVSGQSFSQRGKSLSPPAVTVKYGPQVPNILVAECPERSVLRGSGASSHTGSSDPDSMTEEDIDRLVALHKNRSLSSLGVCSESMSSVYSAAGGGHYGTVTVRGEAQFGLSYNYVSGALEVHIKQCRDLAPVDAKRNRSDPYVKVYLLPDKSKSGKRKTRVKKHTLNPLFNEILKFHVTISELETRTLWMTVWHSDMFGRNEFLGEVTLPMGYEAWDDTSPKWYILQERLGSPEEVYSYKGDLVLALKFVPPDVTTQRKGKHSKGALHVLVKEARNLMAVCANGTSDPFCKCYLLPDKGKSNKQKTHVVKKSCNPKWNHTFIYEDISLDQLRERCLELTIWDYDRLTSNDFLGGVRLSLGTGRHQGKKVDWIDSRAEEVAMWEAMMEKPNFWVDATILLRPTMDHRQTTTW